MPKPPNVIWCVCDQLRAFNVGCYGHRSIQTPHLDQLAQQGVQVETACTNNPVCTPARSIMLTGQYSRTANGMLGNTGHMRRERRHLRGRTVAEALGDHGYHTAAIGKWHMQPLPDVVGFDEYSVPFFRHRHRHRVYVNHHGGSYAVSGYSWDHEDQLLDRFLSQQQDADEPFFLYYNIEPPHMPVAEAPDRYTRMYDPDKVELRPNVFVDGQMAHDENWFQIYNWDYRYYIHHEPECEHLLQGYTLRHLTALYDGLVSLVDDQVGRMMAHLRERGLDDNTIVIFTSDHGDNLGSHHQFNKGQLIEESIRVPMLFHWPGQLKPRRVQSQVVSLIDLLPTTLGMLGHDAPDTVQGTDVSSVLRGEPETVGENAAFIEAGGCAFGIRTLQHTYGVAAEGDCTYRYDPLTRQIADDAWLFFDNRADPYQQHNLAKTGDQQDVACTLRQRVLDWHAQTPFARAAT